MLEALNPQTGSYSGVIRVFGPYKLPLSAQSKTLLDTLEQKLRVQNVANTATKSVTTRSIRSFSARGIGPRIQQVSPLSFGQSSRFAIKADFLPSSNWSAVVVPEPLRRSSGPRSCQHTTAQRPSQRARRPRRTNITRTSEEEAIAERLQVLFHCEYVILTEYVECTLPIFYAVYLAGLYHLPTAAYYPFTRSMTPAKMASTLVQLVIYGFFEFGSLVGCTCCSSSAWAFPQPTNLRLC